MTRMKSCHGSEDQNLKYPPLYTTSRLGSNLTKCIICIQIYIVRYIDSYCCRCCCHVLSLFASHSQYVSVSFCKYKYYLVTCGSDPSTVPGEFGKRAAGPSGLRIVGVVEKDLISC